MNPAVRPISEVMQTDFVTLSLHDPLDFADQVMRAAFRGGEPEVLDETSTASAGHGP